MRVADIGSHRLVREAGLRVRSRKRWRLVSNSLHALPIAPDHLDRQFDLGSRQPALGLGHDLRADGLRLVASHHRARSQLMRRRRLDNDQFMSNVIGKFKPLKRS